MITLNALFRECCAEFKKNGIVYPYFEARLLINKFCGVSENDFIISPELDVTGSAELVRRQLSRRISGEPLQYILGEWEFYGLPFLVGEGVLIPRQDTEIIAKLAAEFADAHKHEGFTAVDLCAGSGCIGITIAVRSGVPVKLVELSEKAAEYLKKNIALNNVSGLCEPIIADVLSEKTAALVGEADLIVTNPPYLSAEDMSNLQTEVKAEPKQALYGGEDGLDYYRKIIPLWSGKLKKGGMLAAETGLGQEKSVMNIFERCGIAPQFGKDLGGIIRVIYGIKQ